MQSELADGNYYIDVKLSGGSGRASINSPTEMTVSDGNISAEIEWSSPNYDLMQIGEEKYFPIKGKENSTFLVNIPALDEDIPILAETVAMSEPHMIEYTICFDSESVKPVNNIQTAFIAIPAAAVIAAAITIFMHKRKKKNEKTN